MRSDAKQTHDESGRRGIRVGVWLAVVVLVFVAVIVICLPRRSAPDNADGVANAVTPTTAGTAGQGWRVQRRGRLQQIAEHVYQGKPLSEWVADFYSTEPGARQAAFDAFRAMGADASLAIPSLVEFLYSSPIPNAAAWALVHIGTNSLSVLTEALTNGNATTRMEVAGAIGFLRDGAESAVPALAECLRHEHAGVRGNAIASLQAIPRRPDIVVPALAICLRDTDDGVRCNAVTTIRNFGRDAEIAVPALVDLARHDSDSTIRSRAADSLRAISPERADSEGL